MTWSLRTLAATALACSLSLPAQAQPSAPAPATPAPATPAPPTPAPGPPPGAQGHWVYVQDGAPGATAPAPAAAPAAAPAPAATLAPVPAATEAAIKRGPVYARANTWDLNIEGAFGRYLGDDAKWTGFVRARAGILFVREPLYNAIGFTYEYSSLEKATFGIQAEVLHLDSGFWGQLGGLLDTSGNPGVMAALGFSLFGVEAQYRTYAGLGDGVAVYAKIRAPIGVLAYVFGVRDAAKNAAKTPPPAPPAAPAQ